MADTIHIRMTRRELRARLAQLPGILAGTQADPNGLDQVVPQAVGVEALSILREAFIAKSRGGADEAGLSWLPLSKKYVAYGRRHPGLNAKRTKAAAKERTSRPLLTEAQNARWKKLYSTKLFQLARSKGVGLIATVPGELKGQAAAYAWAILKAEGAKTILGAYGDAQVEIGRDTGRLFASLSPGQVGNVLQAEPGSVVVGTNVEYAGRFHARRPLWPPPDQWPAQWLGRLLRVALNASHNIALALAGRP